MDIFVDMRYDKPDLVANYEEIKKYSPAKERIRSSNYITFFTETIPNSHNEKFGKVQKT